MGGDRSLGGRSAPSARANAAVLVMWVRYAEVCEHVPIAAGPEAARLFLEFTPWPGPGGDVG